MPLHFHPLCSIDPHEKPLRDPLAAFDGDGVLRHVLHLDHDFVFLSVVIVIDDPDGMRAYEAFFTRE